MAELGAHQVSQEKQVYKCTYQNTTRNAGLQKPLSTRNKKNRFTKAPINMKENKRGLQLTHQSVKTFV